MRTIHKFAIIDFDGVIPMPRNADILCVQMQGSWPHIWALVDDETEKEDRRIVTVGTGWAVPDDLGRGDYIGTYQSGTLVWHVFAPKPNGVSSARA